MKIDLDELRGFRNYSRELRNLFEWIRLLVEERETANYFHRWEGDIPLGDGWIYCPGTTPMAPYGLVPDFFPGETRTPRERALSIALVQCQQLYLSSMSEVAVDNVDRLSNLLPTLEPYCSKIRVAVGRAKRGWEKSGYSLNFRLPAVAKGSAFLKCWLEVYEILMELFYIVDVELHSITGMATTQPLAARGNSSVDATTTNTTSTAATLNRETLLATMPNAWRQVYLANQYAESKTGQELTATAAYKWLQEHGFDEHELPIQNTFADYRTKASGHLGEQRKPRRIVDTSRSVVRRSALDTTDDPDD